MEKNKYTVNIQVIENETGKEFWSECIKSETFSVFDLTTYGTDGKVFISSSGTKAYLAVVARIIQEIQDEQETKKKTK